MMTMMLIAHREGVKMVKILLMIKMMVMVMVVITA